MKTLKANNYPQVLKELEALGADEGVVKNEIKECDKGHFHVVAVRIEQTSGIKNKAYFNIKKFHRAGYEKFMKGFVALGLSKVILLHDPTVKNGEDSETIEPVKTETPEEVEKRIQAEVDKRVKAQMEAKEKSNPNPNGEGSESKNDVSDDTGSDSDPIESQMGEDYWGQTIDDMKKFAKDNDIDLTGLKKKDDIKSAILAWLEDQKEK